jgi:hypothetical protein
MAPPASYQGVLALLLLDKSPLFAQATLVSFYYHDAAGFELLIGLGHVAIVQEDGLIQVALESIAPSHRELLPSILARDAQVLPKISVKPFVPHSTTLSGALGLP